MDFTDVIKELEEEEAMRSKRVTQQIFKSMLNQPSLVTINSANAVKIGSQNGFSSFTADFARPILDVDTLQLVSTSIPQCNPSIPDTATTFWYYRLSRYSGTAPSLNNLYCVRLLPSFYKPEFVTNPDTCGFNKTFANYTSLATQLAKSCVRDIGYENLLATQATGFDVFQEFPFLPGDISITHNTAYNKFQMTGNTTKLAYKSWDVATTYALGDVVVYNNAAYASLQNANVGKNPADLGAFWRTSPQTEVVLQWSETIEYGVGNLVTYANVLYKAINPTYQSQPDESGSDWFPVNPDNFKPYHYLITGYDDPNVAIKQGELFDYPWEPTRFYGIDERVLFKGRYFKTRFGQTSVFVPGNVRKFTPGFPYSPFSVVYYKDNFVRYDFDLVNANIENWTVLQPNPVDKPLWVSTVTYNFGDMVYYNDMLWKSIVVNETVTPWTDNVLIPAATTVAAGGNKYTAVIASRNVSPLQSAISIWFSPFSYVVGNAAFVVGVGAYVCIKDISGGTLSPNNDFEHWAYVGATADISLWWSNAGPVLVNVNRAPEDNPIFWVMQAEHPFNALPFVNGLTYPMYAMAYFDNQLWVATRQTTSTNEDDWVAVGRLVWDDYNYQYIPALVDGQVYYRGKYYQCSVSSATEEFPPIDDWDPKTAYTPNQYVGYFGIVWLSISASPAGVPPTANAWSPTTIYKTGDYVTVSGFLFRCIKDVGPSAVSPVGDFTHWVLVPQNWSAIGADIWVPNTIVLGTKTGLSALSKEHDFVLGEITSDDELDTRPFPVDIAGQPYTPSPKRLLNSILGFTWNALFEPELLIALGEGRAIRDKAVPLYNRLRPVPNYEVDEDEEEPEMLGDILTPPALTTYTYTADGYANLVYSSIIQIYTNIVGGATLDTMRDTNLLATTSMNCGNLGIAYHANYIDNPLLRVAGGDIDSVYIELRDEMGDPFFLTNNAVMSLTFKVTYRERPRVEA